MAPAYGMTFHQKVEETAAFAERLLKTVAELYMNDASDNDLTKRPQSASLGPWPHQASGSGRTVVTSWTSLRARYAPRNARGTSSAWRRFVEQHRARLEEMLRTHGPGSKPASHGRYALMGQPETLIIVERIENAPFLLRGQWEKELKTVCLDDLEFAWGPHIRLSQ